MQMRDLKQPDGPPRDYTPSRAGFLRWSYRVSLRDRVSQHVAAGYCGKYASIKWKADPVHARAYGQLRFQLAQTQSPEILQNVNHSPGIGKLTHKIGSNLDGRHSITRSRSIINGVEHR